MPTGFDFNAPSTNTSSNLIQDQELKNAWQRVTQTKAPGFDDIANLKTAVTKAGFNDVDAMATARGWKTTPAVTTPTTPSFLEAPKVTDSTADLRSQNDALQKSLADAEAKAKADADAKAAADAAAANPYQSYMDKLAGKSDVSTLTDTQQATVKTQEELAAQEGDIEIRKQEIEKAAGLGQDLVKAGEQGGFMNTQFTGLAAEAGITPEMSMIMQRYGVGGQLSKIKSEYDFNIMQANYNKQKLIADARKAATDAAISGNQKDFDNAKTLLNEAENADKVVSQLETEKVQRLQTEAQTAMTKVETIQKSLDTTKQTLDMAAPALEKMDVSQLAEYATANSIPVEQVYAAKLQYAETKKKQDILNTKELQDVLSKTEKGGTLDLSQYGLGKVKVLGVNDVSKAPTTLETTAGILQYIKKADGSYGWVNTGYKSASTEQTLAAIDKLRVETAQLGGGGVTGLPAVGAVVNASVGTGTITSYGSPADAHLPEDKRGLDISLQGGIGAEVKSPVSGTVQIIPDPHPGKGTGYGNEVVIKGDDGKTIRIGHLSAFNVTNGQKVNIGDVIAKQGNTGKVIASPGGTGAHLDIRVDGMTPQQVAQYIGLGGQTTLTALPADTSIRNKPSSSYGGLTPSAVWQKAILSLTTGKSISALIGSMSGKGNIGVAKDAVSNTAAAIADASGVNVDQLLSEYAANKAAVTQLEKQNLGVGAYEAQALKNADLVTKFSDQYQRTGTPLQNKYKNWSAGQLEGDPKLSQFEASIYAFSREYAKIVGGGAMGAAALTDSASSAADHLLNAAMTKEQLNATMDVMKLEMDNRRASINDTLANSAQGLPNLTKLYTYLNNAGVDESQSVTSANPVVQSAFDYIKSNKLQGVDGFISPDTWGQMKQNWIQSGGDSQSFDTTFAIYKNPTNKNYK